MSTTFTDITYALSSHLAALPNKPDIAPENYSYEPTTGELYLQENTLPGDTTQAGLSSDGIDEHLGVYQVTVIAPAGGTKSAAIDWADQIANHFSRGTVVGYNTTNVRIRDVSRGAGQIDGSWWRVPVNINYAAYTAPR